MSLVLLDLTSQPYPSLPAPWYVSNVSIIFDAPCLFLHHLLSVSLQFVAFLCIFGTNLLTRCHSVSSLFSAVFVFQKSYTGNRTKQKLNIQILNEASRRRKRRRSRARGWPHHRAARPAPGLRPLWVRPPWSTSDAAPLPIKTPPMGKT
jgi:hypothetical protein